MSASTINHRVTLRLQRSRERKWSCSLVRLLGSQAQEKTLGLSPFPALLRGEIHFKGFLCFKLYGRMETQRVLSDWSKGKFKGRRFHPLNSHTMCPEMDGRHQINTNPNFVGPIQIPRDLSGWNRGRTALGLPWGAALTHTTLNC